MVRNIGITWKQSLLTLKLSILVSCGTWLGNPPDREGEGTKKVQPETEDVTLVFSGSQGRTFDITDGNGDVIGVITLHENRHVLKNIYLYAEEKPDQPGFIGPYVVDLLEGSVLPTPPPTNLPIGKYTNASITGHTLQAGEIAGIAADDELIGASSIVRGDAVFGDVTYPFNFRFNWDEEVFVGDSGEAGKDSEVVAGLSNELVIAIDYAKWFQLDSPLDLFDEQKLVQHLLNTLRNETSFHIERR